MRGGGACGGRARGGKSRVRAGEGARTTAGAGEGAADGVRRTARERRHKGTVPEGRKKGEGGQWHTKRETRGRGKRKNNREKKNEKTKEKARSQRGRGMVATTEDDDAESERATPREGRVETKKVVPSRVLAVLFLLRGVWFSLSASPLFLVALDAATGVCGCGIPCCRLLCCIC